RVPKAVAERVGRVEEERGPARYERPPAYVGDYASLVLAQPGREQPAGDALLPPGTAERELAACMEDGQLRGRSGAAGRAVVGAAWAHHKVAAVGVRTRRRPEQLDVVDLRAVRPADALPAQRVLDP